MKADTQENKTSHLQFDTTNALIHGYKKLAEAFRCDQSRQDLAIIIMGILQAAPAVLDPKEFLRFKQETNAILRKGPL